KVSNDRDREISEELIVDVAQGLGRRNDDRLARVNPHRIHVFHVANGDAVVAIVPNDFVLDLLPPKEAFFDEDLRYTRECSLSRRGDILFGKNCRRPLAPEREGAAEDHGEADFTCRQKSLGYRQSRATARYLDANLAHFFDEELAILGSADA